jgi:hypothetical protein
MMGRWDDLVNAVNMARGRYKYSPLPSRDQVREAQEALSFWSQRHRTVLKVTMAAMALVMLFYLATATA